MEGFAGEPRWTTISIMVTSADTSDMPTEDPLGQGEDSSLLTLHIKNLRLHVILGVYEEERRLEREIPIDVQLTYSATTAVLTDSIDAAIDYKDVRDSIVQSLTGTSFRLLESLADHIVRTLTLDRRIVSLRLEVHKQKALRGADSVSVIVSWGQNTQRSPKTRLPADARGQQRR